MQKYSFKAPAKLNLFLHVLNKNSNNYHNLQSFVVFLNLFDRLTFSKSSTTSLNISGAFKGNLDTTNNLIISVINFMKNEFNISDNFFIELEKNIPVAAGLGGGSSDAAATLKAINYIYNLNLTLEQLASIGVNFGADVPSCVYSESGLMEGIGEKFTPYRLNFVLPLLIINPLFEISTKNIFSGLTIKHIPNIISNIDVSSFDLFLKFLLKQENHLTEPALKIAPKIKEILETLNKTNPIISRMTGSGATCFAIYKNQKELKEAYNFLRNYYKSFFICITSNIENFS